MGMFSSSLTSRTSELIGTIGIILPMRTLPEGLIVLPFVRAVISSSGAIEYDRSRSGSALTTTVRWLPPKGGGADTPGRPAAHRAARGGVAARGEDERRIGLLCVPGQHPPDLVLLLLAVGIPLPDALIGQARRVNPVKAVGAGRHGHYVSLRLKIGGSMSLALPSTTKHRTPVRPLDRAGVTYCTRYWVSGEGFRGDMTAERGIITIQRRHRCW